MEGEKDKQAGSSNMMEATVGSVQRLWVHTEMPQAQQRGGGGRPG